MQISVEADLPRWFGGRLLNFLVNGGLCIGRIWPVITDRAGPAGPMLPVPDGALRRRDP
jgi:hypothetical protein